MLAIIEHHGNGHLSKQLPFSSFQIFSYVFFLPLRKFKSDTATYPNFAANYSKRRSRMHPASPIPYRCFCKRPFVTFQVGYRAPLAFKPLLPTVSHQGTITENPHHHSSKRIVLDSELHSYWRRLSNEAGPALLNPCPSARMGAQVSRAFAGNRQSRAEAPSRIAKDGSRSAETTKCARFTTARPVGCDQKRIITEHA